MAPPLLLEPSYDQRLKIIVGVDFGTTYSGISWVLSSKCNYGDINVINDWPCGATGRDGETLYKVPSMIAFASENIKFELDKDLWGYEVEPGMRTYMWTKLLLDNNSAPTDYDDPSLEAVTSQGLLRLPADKSAEDLVEGYLSKLYKYCLQHAEQARSPQIIAVTPIEFWFTLPATWSDEAQARTKRAARRAGFGSRRGDTLHLIMEPEAAAIAALKCAKEKNDDVFQPKQKLLICDCGGGTVDITTYTIIQVEPNLELEETCPGIGGKCGSTFIDRNFHKLMSERFGEAFRSLPLEKRGLGSRFMREFESAKRDFREDSSRRRPSALRLLMPDVPHSNEYDFETGEVLLSNDDMKSCFEPVVTKILELVSSQLDAVLKETGESVDVILLVGGFGSSLYLWSRLRTFCMNHGNITLITPEISQTAIVRGAALRGLEGAVVPIKRCKRHYGITLAVPFDPSIHQRDESRMFTVKFHDKAFINGSMFWQIKKGEKIGHNTEKSINFQIYFEDSVPRNGSMILFSSSLDSAPEWETHPRCEKVGAVRFSLANLNVLSKARRRKTGFLFWGTKHYALDLVCKVRFVDGDVLQYTVMCHGVNCGSTTIDFAHT